MKNIWVKRVIIILVCCMTISFIFNKFFVEDEELNPKTWMVTALNPDKKPEIAEAGKEWSEPIMIEDWANFALITKPACVILLKVSKTKHGLKSANVWKFNTREENQIGDMNFNFMSLKLPKESELEKVTFAVFTKSKI